MKHEYEPRDIIHVKKGNPILLTETRDSDINNYSRLVSTVRELNDNDFTSEYGWRISEVTLDKTQLVIRVRGFKKTAKYVNYVNTDWILNKIRSACGLSSLQYERKKVPVVYLNAIAEAKTLIKQGCRLEILEIKRGFDEPLPTLVAIMDDPNLDGKDWSHQILSNVVEIKGLYPVFAEELDKVMNPTKRLKAKVVPRKTEDELRYEKLLEIAEKHGLKINEYGTKT